MYSYFKKVYLVAGLLLIVATFQNCSSGGNSASPVDGEDNSQGGTEPEITLQIRTAAATETANSNPACVASELTEGFYWEIGDRDGIKASGTVTGTNTPEPTQVIAIASASKWIYATYALQKIGSFRSSDLPFFNFTSGYLAPLATEASCQRGETVSECAADVTQVSAAVNKFYYSAGHFQHHAANLLGIGAMDAQELTTEVRGKLGNFDFVYFQTNLAGGVNASASSYASFLQKILRGEYLISPYLGENKVCASAACASGAVLSPAPPDEAWNYSLGHWVEDDPVLGDGAFSSAGALGFYPWIDASKKWYGILARRAGSTGGNEGFRSTRCGRLIRQAWMTGITATGMTPNPKNDSVAQ